MEANCGGSHQAVRERAERVPQSRATPGEGNLIFGAASGDYAAENESSRGVVLLAGVAASEYCGIFRVTCDDAVNAEGAVGFRERYIAGLDRNGGGRFDRHGVAIVDIRLHALTGGAKLYFQAALQQGLAHFGELARMPALVDCTIAMVRRRHGRSPPRR
jgi:hypothetical protein